LHQPGCPPQAVLQDQSTSVDHMRSGFRAQLHASPCPLHGHAGPCTSHARTVRVQFLHRALAQIRFTPHHQLCTSSTAANIRHCLCFGSCLPSCGSPCAPTPNQPETTQSSVAPSRRHRPTTTHQQQLQPAPSEHNPGTVPHLPTHWEGQVCVVSRKPQPVSASRSIRTVLCRIQAHTPIISIQFSAHPLQALQPAWTSCY
jgi:hypothetical protein